MEPDDPQLIPPPTEIVALQSAILTLIGIFVLIAIITEWPEKWQFGFLFLFASAVFPWLRLLMQLHKQQTLIGQINANKANIIIRRQQELLAEIGDVNNDGVLDEKDIEIKRLNELDLIQFVHDTIIRKAPTTKEYWISHANRLPSKRSYNWRLWSDVLISPAIEAGILEVSRDQSGRRFTKPKDAITFREAIDILYKKKIITIVEKTEINA